MRINLFKNGAIDEVIVNGCDLEIHKAGSARYRFIISCDSKIEFNLWTTKLGFIDFHSENINYLD